MRTFILSGSMRPNSQTRKVANFIQHSLSSENLAEESFLLDLGHQPLPLWTKDREKDSAFLETWNPIYSELEKADSLVILSPEWNGMATPGVLNFLLLCDNKILAHKPVLLVGVSNSRGGGTVISELRSYGLKNTFYSAIPEHLIIHNVESMMNNFDLKLGEKDDIYIKNRTIYAIKLLKEYAQALQLVRDSGVINLESYVNGMS